MIDINKTNPIARGRTAEIYDWDDGLVLKLFFPNFSSVEAEEEATVTRAISSTGFKAVTIKEVVEIAGRKGIVMEKIIGESLLTHLQADLNQAPMVAHLLADLHVNLHQYQSHELPEIRSRLRERINWSDRLPNDVRAKIISKIDQLPDGNSLCHGDFHPDNILQTADGPRVIDWHDAFRGHPLADVARSSLLLTTGSPPDLPAEQLAALMQLRQQFNELYLARYLDQQSYSKEEIEPWILPMAAARLVELTADEQQPVLDLIEQRL